MVVAVQNVNEKKVKVPIFPTRYQPNFYSNRKYPQSTREVSHFDVKVIVNFIKQSDQNKNHFQKANFKR